MNGVATSTKQFDQALRDARRSEAARLDALQNVTDAKALRLIGLQEQLLKALPDDSDVQQLLDLRFEPGEVPRLMIDLITSVTIAPDAHTFCLMQDRDSRRETLLETGNAATMTQHILKYAAHRLIARERRFAAQAPARADWRFILATCLASAAGGAVLFAAIAKSLGKLNF